MENSSNLKTEQTSIWQPLKIRNFRLLFIGEGVSLLGDQFYLVALPWLTLQITGSPLSLGGVLTAVAVPRAILMLIGGALSDRFSPRLIMIVTNVLRAGLTAILALLVMLQATELWHLYLLAISFGIVEGFFSPAAETIVPTLVPEKQLIASNVLGQSAMQLISLIGPALAGVLIAAMGVGIAFAIDAASFVVSTLALLLIRIKPIAEPSRLPAGSLEQSDTTDASSEPIGCPACAARASTQPSPEEAEPTFGGKMKTLMAGISEGLNYCWNNRSLRAVLIVLTLLNLLFVGPLQVGINALTYDRFSADPTALGIMISAWGAGGLMGTLTPQWLSRLPRLGILMLSLASIQAVGMMLLSVIPTVAIVSLVIAILGWCSSFFIVVATSWIQTITPLEILGRVMSVAMLSSLGIAPLSYALAGVVADASLLLLFGGAGGTMLVLIGLLALKPSIRAID
ncbi:MAG: MFS transporter [Leptolyngbyaceae cyanobacterium CRU_2_3]|nr:MFS transporter [Leptolyngbyaceae cyanobacterium CRU_2_3]